MCLGIVIKKLNNNSVDINDLKSYGSIGLINAVDSFDSSNGAKFSTYAHYKVYGAIMDGIRKESPFSRKNYGDFSLVPIEAADAVEDVSINMFRDRFEAKCDLEKCFGSLDKKTRMFLSTVVLKDSSNFTISRFFGISEARVSQIISSAMEKMKLFARGLE